MERREFCAHACRVLSLAAAGTLLDACASPTGPDLDGTSAIPRATGNLSSGTITVELSSVPSLATIGGVAIIVTSGLSVLVSKQSDTSYVAVNAICTHEGCTVDRFAGQRYVCPCHGSEFTFVGNVVQGPASHALSTFPSRVTSDVLTIST
jgi:Rieske Fe-S protein